MRKPAYHSPSSLGRWLKDPTDYYLHYLAENRPPRDPQTMAMAAGAGFDALVKGFLGERLGLPARDYWNTQVEERNRAAIKPVATRIFDNYCACGALADLCMLLDRSQGEVQMESEIRGEVTGPDGKKVILLGKPDIYFQIKTTECGVIPVIIDWKVNGIFRNDGSLNDRTTSPVAGYSKIYPGGDCHKDYVPYTYCGVTLGGVPLEKDDWARQLATYSWLIGTPIGAPVITGIDQIVGPLDKMRVAEHRAVISEGVQLDTWKGYVELEEAISSGWIFRDLSREASLEKQTALDRGELDTWSKMMRPR